MDTTRQALEALERYDCELVSPCEGEWSAEMYPEHDGEWLRRSDVLFALTSMDAAPQGVVEAGDAMRRLLSEIIMDCNITSRNTGRKRNIADLVVDAAQSWDAAKSRTTPAVALRSGGYDELYRWLKEGKNALGLSGSTPVRFSLDTEDKSVSMHVGYYWSASQSEEQFNRECTRHGLQYILIQPEQK